MPVVLFDFFGTLVEYEPDPASLDYPRSFELAAGWGSTITTDGFVTTWDAALSRLEHDTKVSHVEFSMRDAADAVAEQLDVALTEQQRRQLAATFLDEWQAHVRPVTGAVAMIERLAASHTLGIVSNTHDSGMVPAMLDEMGVTDCFAAVVLSIDHGLRKPHPSIYAAALDTIGVDPADIVFVGDSYDADYAGPRAVGMAAFLIDPDRRSRIPDEHRLSIVTEIEQRV